ncbi:cyclic peptide export ABC transporter [Methylovulum psychrotolerans]|uniref:cyclic peptide export ABC transporter n=1 Tax=Methylovulum psychrotolerans TaxID=1704499 RepID=UPI001BFEFE41|nr:cyclic peptide export ABC transporter [Methylovulum psychrotolerans]MBT9100303.1 cyclic peptide export ABC transporter [Methylovulum psychrotolerans]
MFGYLWRTSWQTIVWVLIIGITSGLGSAALIATINQALSVPSEALLGQFVGLCALVLLSETLSFSLTSRLSEATIYKLRIRISQLILGSPYPNLQKLGKAALLANLTTDIATLSQAFMLLPEICIHGAVVVGCLAYLAWLSWQMALVLTGIIIVTVGTYRLLTQAPGRAFVKAREEYDKLGQSFRHLTEGIKELKLHAERSRDFMTRSLAASAENHRRLTLFANVTFMLANKYTFLVYYLAIGLILFGGLWHQAAPEVVSGYVLVLLFMTGHLAGLTHSLPAFVTARIALDKITQLGEALQTEPLGTPNAPLPKQWATFQSLTLDEVTHSFHREKENRRFTLGPINLEFRPGELVFLVGGNGSGKTTLAMLLMGLYHPELGEIRYNGVRISAANREAYLQQFAVVFADFYLFDELFGFDADKITYKLMDYLERLHLQHKLTLNNGRFSTTALSQGQCKRLALLVAYLEDRPFYIFDEWAADQDPEFKELFYTELLPELKAKGKTVLAITHDDRYFHLADRCITLEEGQIKAIDYPPVTKPRPMVEFGEY